VSRIVQHLKGESSRKLQMEFPQLQKTFWGQHMWAIGYFCATTGTVTERVIKKYIEDQGKKRIRRRQNLCVNELNSIQSTERSRFHGGLEALHFQCRVMSGSRYIWHFCRQESLYFAKIMLIHNKKSVSIPHFVYQL